MGSSGRENKRKERPRTVYTWRAAQRDGRPPQLQGPPGHCHQETRIRLQPGSQGLALEILPAVSFEECPTPTAGQHSCGLQRAATGARAQTRGCLGPGSPEPPAGLGPDQGSDPAPALQLWPDTSHPPRVSVPAAPPNKCFQDRTSSRLRNRTLGGDCASHRGREEGLQSAGLSSWWSLESLAQGPERHCRLDPRPVQCLQEGLGQQPREGCTRNTLGTDPLVWPRHWGFPAGSQAGWGGFHAGGGRGGRGTSLCST